MYFYFALNKHTNRNKAALNIESHLILTCLVLCVMCVCIVLLMEILIKLNNEKGGKRLGWSQISKII